jgi:hypothetical protein
MTTQHAPPGRDSRKTEQTFADDRFLSIWFDKHVDFVRLPSRSAFPQEVTVGLEVLGAPEIRVRMTLQVVAGEPQLVDLAFSGSPITSSIVREIPIDNIVSAAIRKVQHIVDALESPRKRRYDFEFGNVVAKVKSERSSGVEGLPNVISRSGLEVSDQNLLRVAEIVRTNLRNPRQQVAADLHLSGRTASRWIAAARKRGLIGVKE